MSSIPLPKLSDSKPRWKRNSLAREIRKFRRDLKLRVCADSERFGLDRERFNLEPLKFERDAAFWVRLGPAIVTSIAAVAGALNGLFGVLYSQQTAKTNYDAGTNIRQNAAALISSISDQIDLRAKILADNSVSVAKRIFSRLKRQSDSKAAKQLWDQGLQVTSSSGGSPAAIGGTVYAHYKESTHPSAVSAVIRALTEAGYYVPRKQKVVQDTNGDIRCSAGPDDNAIVNTAKSIASLMQGASASVGVNVTTTPINVHATFPTVPATTFEVRLPAMPN